ncbi:hypothetical protein DXG01_010865 [Tephrocybe rancida]|nr:hypothetical protein DXG01_010865 [Tephrocybe rancida]
MLCVLSMRMRGAIRNAAQASHNVWHLPPIRVSCSILVEDMRRVDALEWFGDRILSGLLTDILNEDFISFPQQFTTLCRPLLAANATLALLMVKMKLKMNGTKEEIKTKGDLFEVIVALYACEQPRHVVREWLKSVFDPLVRVAAIEYLLHYSTSGLPYFPRKVHDETTKRKALHPIPASMPSTTTLPAGTNWNESTPPQPERTNPESWALFSLTSSTVDQRPSDSPLECSASQTAKLNPSPSRGRKALCEMGKASAITLSVVLSWYETRFSSPHLARSLLKTASAAISWHQHP